jgi:hypothetical protein
MHIIRKKAKQGYPIPSHSYKPLGPFNQELFAKAPIKYPDEPPLEPSTPIFLCRGCGAHLFEDELPDHNCDDEE